MFSLILCLYVGIVGATVSNTSCVDSKDDFIISTGETTSCQWIRQNKESLEQMCERYQIQSQCISTCGKCCEDDIEFFMQTKDGGRIGCDGIAMLTKVEKHRICSVTSTRISCSKTCDTCIQYKTDGPSSPELIDTIFSSGGSQSSFRRFTQRVLRNLFTTESSAAEQSDETEMNIFSGSGKTFLFLIR